MYNLQYQGQLCYQSYYNPKQYKSKYTIQKHYKLKLIFHYQLSNMPDNVVVDHNNPMQSQISEMTIISRISTNISMSMKTKQQ